VFIGIDLAFRPGASTAPNPARKGAPKMTIPRPRLSLLQMHVHPPVPLVNWDNS